MESKPSLNITSSYKLNNGVDMPIFGLGTWKAEGSDVGASCAIAWKAGYRHIDTASLYANEKEIGDWLQKSGIKREEVFITSKIWNDEHGDVEAAFNRSLKKLQTDYIDLYLIHYPVPERNKSLKVLEKLYKAKKVRAIGVSNFCIKHFENFLSNCEIQPTVN